MPIHYIYAGEPMTGTDEDDFFIAYKGSTATDNNTVNANDGDDLVIGDSSDTWLPGASYLNGSIAAAFNLETLTSPWTTAENEMFGDWTIPHTTVMAEATIGQSEYYRIAIGAGQQITIDLDFASNTAIGTTRDLVVELQDSLGNVIVSADDSLVSQGGQGSFPSSPGSASSYDPFLTFTVPTGGIYYINVRPFGSGPGSTFSDNNTFLMNVSVTGHAVNATNPVQGADTINGGEGNDALFGQGGGDVINGDGGDDFIDSGSGGDIVHGGTGNDTIYGGNGTEENVHGDADNDSLHSGGEGHYYGDAGDDIIYAGLTAGVNEILDGGADVDTIDTTTWNGTYILDLVTGVTNFGESFINFENAVTGNGTDTVTGTAGANRITTQGGIDTVNAGAGNDVVSGGADGDMLDGGADFDILDYHTSSGAVTINLATNSASGGHAAGDVISNFEGAWGSVLGDTLTGTGGDNELRGFEGNDTLTGGGGNDILDGGLNDDVMTGGLGNDTYYVDSLGDTVNEALGEGVDTIAAGFNFSIASNLAIERLRTLNDAATTAINLTGNSLANLITGNAGNNTLNGGAAGDLMQGLGGDDFYVVDNAADQVVESAGGGTDRVFASISYTLAAGTQVDILSTTNNVGLDAINFTGNALAQAIIGNNGANTLDSGGGGGAMGGLGGNDLYFVRSSNDRVVEAAGEGTDRVFAGASFVLDAGSSVETISTIDQAATTAINVTGNALVQLIVGNAGANWLDSGGGGDTMAGLGGNDFYFVRSASDRAVEAAGGGTDRVFAAVSFVLEAGSSIETLGTILNAGLDAINLTGNALAQTIFGNEGANTLDGGGGGDTMFGMGGNDFYFVRNGTDQVVESAGGGSDRIFTAVSFALGGASSVETLGTTNNAGTTAINLTGSTVAQTIFGNAGANTLDGGGGGDTMFGFGGNDFYIIRSASDRAVEAAAGGNDRVFAAVSFTLEAGSEVETLSTDFNAAVTPVNLTGNALAQSIIGNAGANILDGKSGVDTLTGFGGADIFAFTTALGAGNVDQVADFQAGVDKIRLENAIFTGLSAGALPAGAFVTGTAALDADDRIIYNSATGALLFDLDGAGGTAAVQFATLQGLPALSASDFVVI